MNYNIEKKYIYATIVNKNEDIPNAIVLAHSIKTNGSMYKIIVKISKNIENIILMNFFDRIVYSDKDFDDYNKVLLISINSITNKNLDYLFNINNISNIEINNNIIHYDEKPYLYENKISIEERIITEEYILWFRYYREIINNDFDLLNNTILQECNDMFKYFTTELSLYIPKKNKNINNNNKYLNLNVLYDININKNYEYYHTNISKEYNSTFINFYTDNININDFVVFINNILIKKYNEKKYKHIKEFLDDCENKEIIIDIYLKYSPTILIILINNDENLSEENKKNIIYKKNINLTNYELKNVLFNINQEYVYDERILYLNKIYTEKNYKITLLCFEIKDFIDFKDSHNIIICENINKKIRASSLLLNKKNKYDFIKEYKNIKNTLVVQSLKKWIYNNFNGEEIMNLIIFIKNNIFIILDKNNYEQLFIKITELNKIKLYFMELIFFYSSSYKNIIEKTKIYTDYNIDDCFEIDGLKFLSI